MSLRVAVPTVVLGVGLIVSALTVALELRQTKERAVATAVQHIGVLSDIMVEEVERGLRRGDPVSVRESLSPIRASRTTVAAVVLDDANRVIEATDRGVDGSPLSHTRFAGDTGLVDGVRRAGRPQYSLVNGGDLLLWAHPFSMPPRAGELLPARSGILLVLYSLDLARSESLSDALSRTGTALSTIALLCALVTWLFHRTITPRIDALVDATESISAGDYRAVPRLKGDDELARIGQAITEMAVILDRSHRELVRSEAELRTFNAELEDRVKERTAESAAYARDMESFAFMIAHDLRTPLRSIAGFAQVLAQDNAKTIGDEGLVNLGRVLLNAKRMSRLIDDVLAFSRHGRQHVATAPVNLSSLARSVSADLLDHYREVERMRALDQGREAPEPVVDERVRIRIDAVPEARGDEGLLRQVLQNLIANAIKYSVIRDSVEIHFGAKADPRGAVYFVADNGIGFEMKYAWQIFAPFKRLHAPGEYEGTGVGLAIVKRIMERHGGSVWARSAVGEGATFYFSFFPAAEAAETVASGDAEAVRRVGEVRPERHS